MSFELRAVNVSDEPFLWEMLFLALFVPPGQPPHPRSVLRDPAIARYVQGWARDATTKDWLRSLTRHWWVQRGYGGSLLPIRVMDLWTRAYLNSALRYYLFTAVKESVHYFWNGYFRASLQPRSVAIRKTQRGDCIDAWVSSRCRTVGKCCGRQRPADRSA